MELEERKKEIHHLIDQDMLFHAKDSIDKLIMELGYRSRCSVCEQLVKITYGVNVEVFGKKKERREICSGCLSKMGFSNVKG